MIKSIVTGIVTGLSPCFLSLLLFLFTVVINMREYKKAAGFTFSFLIGAYTTFLCFSLFYNTVVNYIPQTKMLFIVLYASGFVLSFLFAIFNIYDAVMVKKNFAKTKLKMNTSHKIKIQNQIQNITNYPYWIGLILIFVLGIISTLAILSCSGGIILSYLLNEVDKHNLLDTLLFSIFVFVPGLILTVILLLTKKILYYTSLLYDKMVVIKILNALVLLTFSFIFLYKLYPLL